MIIPSLNFNKNDNNFFQNLKVIKPNVLFFKANPKTFEQTFDKVFFNKLLKEGLPCAYTNVPLIPQSDLNVLRKVQELNVPINLNMDYLMKYNGNLLKNENKLLENLSKEMKKNPELGFNEIIEKIIPQLENNLHKNQVNIITKALFIAKKLPKEDYCKVASILTESFKDVFNIETSIKPSENYLIAQIKDLELEDKKTCNQIYKELNKLSQEKVVNGFVIKNSKNRELNEQNFIIRILELCASTIEHIHPQVFQKNDFQKSQKQNGLSMVVILSNYFINQQKANVKFDDFIKQSPFNVKKNLQKHVDRLIEIFTKWQNENKKQDCELLSSYILCLKKELEKRASGLKINIDALKQLFSEKVFEQKNNEIQQYF